MSTGQEKQPLQICPVCRGTVFRVDSTWKTADGSIHRRRVCVLCEEWGFQTEETPTGGHESCICGNVEEQPLTTAAQEATNTEAEQLISAPKLAARNFVEWRKKRFQTE